MRSKFNPDYTLAFVMKVANTIKTSVCADFLLAIKVNYGNNKKSSKRLCLNYLKTVIEFYCLIWVYILTTPFFIANTTKPIRVLMPVFSNKASL